MPKPSWENLDVFLDDDEFAVQATIAFQAGTTKTVRGIFDDPYLNAQLGEYELDTSNPRLTCKESDVVSVRRGDEVTIDGKTYDVLSPAQTDGTGMAVLSMALQQG